MARKKLSVARASVVARKKNAKQHESKAHDIQANQPPISLDWYGRNTKKFRDVFNFEMKKYGDSCGSLTRALIKLGYQFAESGALNWKRGRHAPRSKKAFEILKAVERRYGLPAGHFRASFRMEELFNRYLELGAIGPLLEELNLLGIKTKKRNLRDGRTIGGGKFWKGALNHFLKNPTYVGEIHHRGEVHAGDHEPIVERSIFDAVQEKLKSNSVARKLKLKSSPFLLAGLLFDSAGNRMTPTHTVKKGARYRYYVSQAVVQCRKSESGSVSRVTTIIPVANDELKGLRGPGYRRIVDLSAAGRGGTPDEVGNVGALSMDEEGAFITGNDFFLDGGVTAAN